MGQGLGGVGDNPGGFVIYRVPESLRIALKAGFPQGLQQLIQGELGQPVVFLRGAGFRRGTLVIAGYHIVYVAGYRRLNGFGHRLSQGVGEKRGPDQRHKDGQQGAQGKHKPLLIAQPDEENQDGQNCQVVEQKIHKIPPNGLQALFASYVLLRK